MSPSSLLPSGLYDLLPEEAELESHLIAGLLGVFHQFGYEQITPPLLEFEDTLLAGRGNTLSAQTFRLMDPLSHRMMALRADMTMQIARIATSRLSNLAKPLRLCYAGQVLRVALDHFYGQRQLTQVGIELIGANSPEADAEVIIVAAEALTHMGLQNITVDLNIPGLIDILLGESTLSPENRIAFHHAISQKDKAALARFSYNNGELIAEVTSISGNAEITLEHIMALALPPKALALCADVQKICAIVTKRIPSIALTADLAENRGFDYHSSFSFSLFSRGIATELGRGGRYSIESQDQTTIEGTGFTLYINPLLRTLPPIPPSPRIFLPLSTPAASAKKLRAEGYVTLHALHPEDNIQTAKQLRCGYIYQNGKIEAL